MTRAARRLNPQFLFLGLAVGINILVMVLARNAASPRSNAVAVGAVLDMTVTVPALYYWLVVRPGLRNMASLGLIALLSLWRAAFAFPAIVPGKAWIGAAVECLVVGAVVLLRPAGYFPFRRGGTGGGRGTGGLVLRFGVAGKTGFGKTNPPVQPASPLCISRDPFICWTCVATGSFACSPCGGPLEPGCGLDGHRTQLVRSILGGFDVAYF